jgi:predicted protein tyrosine phosphatase
MIRVILLLFFFAVTWAEPRTLRKCDVSGDMCWITAHPDDTTPQEIEEGLWIGNQYAAVNHPALLKRGITHIVTAIGEPTERMEGVEYLVMDFDDGHVPHAPQLLIEAHAFIQHARREGGVVLVHCAAGVSRSATIAISHLMLRHGHQKDIALAMVQKVRSVIQPNTFFMRTLDNLQHYLSPHTHWASDIIYVPPPN